MIRNLTFGDYFLISDFPAESLKANKNQQKRSLVLQYSFAQKPSLFYEPQPTQYCKKYTSRTQPKTLLTLQIFQTCFWLVSKKNICTALFLDAQELHSQSTQKANVFIFLYISVKYILFQRCRKLLSGGGLNHFSKAASCLSLVKFFEIIHFS